MRLSSLYILEYAIPFILILQAAPVHAQVCPLSQRENQILPIYLSLTPNQKKSPPAIPAPSPPGPPAKPAAHSSPHPPTNSPSPSSATTSTGSPSDGDPISAAAAAPGRPPHRPGNGPRCVSVNSASPTTRGASRPFPRLGSRVSGEENCRLCWVMMARARQLLVKRAF